MVEQMRQTIEEYQLYMEEMSTNIVPISKCTGFVSIQPLPFDVSPERFQELALICLQKAKDMGLTYLVLDATSLPAVRMVKNIPAFTHLIESFRLIGVETIMTGLSPEVTRQAVMSGVDLQHIKAFSKLLDGLEYFKKQTK